MGVRKVSRNERSREEPQLTAAVLCGKGSLVRLPSIEALLARYAP